MKIVNVVFKFRCRQKTSEDLKRQIPDYCFVSIFDLWSRILGCDTIVVSGSFITWKHYFLFLFTSFKIANSGYIFGYKLRRKTKNTRTYLFYIEKTKLEKIEKPKLKY